MPTTSDLTDAEIEDRLAAFPTEALTTPCELHGHSASDNGCAAEEPARWRMLAYHVPGAESCAEAVHLVICDAVLRTMQADTSVFKCSTCGKLLRATDLVVLIGEIS
jgi:hypothetical protein